MKKIYIKLFIIMTILLLLISTNKVNADLPLIGKTIIIDAGHGGLDPGTTYKDIYEKNINLSISIYLEKYLSKYGASVILTRKNDSDLANGARKNRKKIDFDNRIAIINQNFIDLYLSIHLNYLANPNYYGAQVFYNKDNYELALSIQNYLNNNLSTNRSIKRIPSSTYMYDKLNNPGVLIECGFLSNPGERKKLLTKNYQEKIAKAIADSIVKYYN